MTRTSRAVELSETPHRPILAVPGMRLRALFQGVELRRPLPNAELEVSALAYDSRKVVAGGAFFAIHGEKLDGNRFVADALERGASAIRQRADAPCQLSRIRLLGSKSPKRARRWRWRRRISTDVPPKR